jgi:hypothetical protein
MDNGELKTYVDRIGHTAGIVWHVLHEQGPQSLAKLTKSVEAPRDTVMQAIGWLAREDKLEIRETKRGKTVTLR